MDVQFVKLHSAGRDFLLVDGFKTPAPDREACAAFSKVMTHRNFGVGAVALIVLKPGEEATALCDIYASTDEGVTDCPDAVLCAARYAFDSGLLGSDTDRIQAEGSTFTVALVDSRNIMLDLGPPRHWQDSLELKDSPELGINEQMRMGGRSYSFSPLRLMGLHAVLFDAEEGLPVSRLRRSCVSHPGFAKPPLVEVVRVYSQEEIRLRVWSPRTGELLSSSSGSGAAVVASVIHGFGEREIVVHTRGGDTLVRWDERSNHVLCTVSVEYSFMGTFYWENG